MHRPKQPTNDSATRLSEQQPPRSQEFRQRFHRFFEFFTFSNIFLNPGSEYIVLDEYRCTDNIDAPEKSKHQKAQKENPRTKITSFEQMSNMSCNVENGRPLLTYRDGSTGCDIKRFEKELAYEKRRFESHWKRVIQKGEQKISMLEAERRRMEKEARERSQSKNSECSDDSTNTDPNASEVSLTDTFSGSGHSSLWVSFPLPFSLQQ